MQNKGVKDSISNLLDMLEIDRMEPRLFPDLLLVNPLHRIRKYAGIFVFDRPGLHLLLAVYKYTVYISTIHFQDHLIFIPMVKRSWKRTAWIGHSNENPKQCNWTTPSDATKLNVQRKWVTMLCVGRVFNPMKWTIKYTYDVHCHVKRLNLSHKKIS